MYNKQRWLISYFSFRKEKWTSAKSIRDVLCFTQRKPPKHTCTVLYWGKVNDQFSVDPQEKDFSVSLTSSERSRGRGAPSVGIPILLFHRFSSSVAVIQTQTVAYLRTPVSRMCGIPSCQTHSLHSLLRGGWSDHFNYLQPQPLPDHQLTLEEPGNREYYPSWHFDLIERSYKLKPN